MLCNEHRDKRPQQWTFRNWSEGQSWSWLNCGSTVERSFGPVWNKTVLAQCFNFPMLSLLLVHFGFSLDMKTQLPHGIFLCNQIKHETPVTFTRSMCRSKYPALFPNMFQTLDNSVLHREMQKRYLNTADLSFYSGEVFLPWPNFPANVFTTVTTRTDQMFRLSASLPHFSFFLSSSFFF